MTLTMAKDAFTRYVHYGDDGDLEMALTICKSLKVPDDLLLSVEAAARKARTELPERIMAWESLPVNERKAILEMRKG